MRGSAQQDGWHRVASRRQTRAVAPHPSIHAMRAKSHAEFGPASPAPFPALHRAAGTSASGRPCCTRPLRAWPQHTMQKGGPPLLAVRSARDAAHACVSAGARARRRRVPRTAWDGGGSGDQGGSSCSAPASVAQQPTAAALIAAWWPGSSSAMAAVSMPVAAVISAGRTRAPGAARGGRNRRGHVQVACCSWRAMPHACSHPSRSAALGVPPRPLPPVHTAHLPPSIQVPLPLPLPPPPTLVPLQSHQ